jgi:hypothetical protein
VLRRPAPGRQGPGVTRRLRPGLHYAPVAGGIVFVSPRRSFALTGPATLLALLDRIVPMLEDGSDVPAMVAALGREELRPAVESVIGSLDRYGMLLDESRLTAPGPTASERVRFAGAIAHLETLADDPNEALRRVRATRAVVRGGGPQAATATEALVNAGFVQVGVHHPPGDEPEPLGETPLPETCAVDDVDGEELEIALFAPGARHPSGPTVTVPVRWSGAVLLSGPVLGGEGDRARHAALLRRVAGWAEREGLDGASRPLGPMLAAAYAAHAAFEWAGLGPGPPVAHVVHSALEADEILVATRPAPLAPAGRPDPGPSPSPSPSPSRAAAPGPGAAPGRGEAGGAEIAHATAAVTAALPLLARWTGLGRWDMPGDLAQIPVAITILAGREATVPERILGWGTTAAHASLDAILGLLRQAARAEDGLGVAVGVAAAGRAEPDGVLDGVLRLLVVELDAGEPLHVSAVDVEGRRRWRTLTDGEGAEPHLVLAGLAGCELTLAEVRGPDGAILAAQWGLGLGSATSAIGAAIAAQRARAAGGGPCRSCDPTSAVIVERPEIVEPIREEARRWLGAHDRTPRSARRGPDAVLGPLPLWSGRVWFA